ncbi:MAG: aminotransferase class I/II-fold pyridoxal phosphate-dependent enzyme [Thermoleophilia bacterium]
MDLPEFALERWFARFEFDVRWNLCASDTEPVSLRELLALADDEGRALWDGLGLGYTESAGHPLLRAEIAGMYDGLEPDDVLVCAGAEEAIFILAGVLAGPGERAVTVVPAYQSLHEVARAAGADVDVVQLDVGAGSEWTLDLDRFRDAVTPSTRLVMVNAPNNPTGWLPDAADFAEIVRIAEAAGAVVVSDEVYRLLEADPADRLPAGAELSDRAVSVGVMSKAFGLAGLRIGWIASRDRDLLARAAARKDWTTICSSAPSEALAIIALRARESLLSRARAIVEGNRALAEGFAAAHPELVEWTPPRGGTTAFPRLVRHSDAEAFALDLARDHDALILPGSAFGADRDRFRLGLGRRDLAPGLDRLSAALTA